MLLPLEKYYLCRGKLQFLLLVCHKVLTLIAVSGNRCLIRYIQFEEFALQWLQATNFELQLVRSVRETTVHQELSDVIEGY